MAISQQFIISLNQLNQKLGETARLNVNVAATQERVTKAFEASPKALRETAKSWDDIAKAQARYNADEATRKTHEYYNALLGGSKQATAEVERATKALQVQRQAQINVTHAGAAQTSGMNSARNAIFQLAAGAQDMSGAFQQMGFTTQGWTMAMRGASNNLGALFLGMGNVASIGGTLALAVLPPLIEYLLKLDDVAGRATEQMGKLFDEMEGMKKQSETMRGIQENIERADERIRAKLRPGGEEEEHKRKKFLGKSISEQVDAMTPEERFNIFGAREQKEIEATTGKEVQVGERTLRRILEDRQKKAEEHIKGLSVGKALVLGEKELLEPGEKGDEARRRYIESQRGLAEREFFETEKGKQFAELRKRYEAEKGQVIERAQGRMERAMAGDISAIPEEGKGIVQKAMPKALEALGKEREKVLREQEHDVTEKKLRDRQNEIQKEQDRIRQARSDIERRLDPRATGTLPRAAFPEIPVAEGKLGTGTQKRLRQAIEGMEAPLDRESFQLKEAIEELNKTLSGLKDTEKQTEQLQTLKNIEQSLKDLGDPNKKPTPLMRPPGAQRPAGQAPQF